MSKTKRIFFSVCALLCVCQIGFAQQQLAGTYVTMISDADVPPELKTMVGKWDLVLSDQGSFNLLQNGEVVVSGNYAVAADQITFSDSSGKMACAEQSTGTYKPVLEAASLTFTLVDDNCASRRIVLLSHPLTKQPGN